MKIEDEKKEEVRNALRTNEKQDDKELRLFFKLYCNVNHLNTLVLFQGRSNYNIKTIKSKDINF